ncbi:T9SS type A sorting domain-containing protein [Spirosoma sordidisoli]|uniref:T9SS type A sorting domain-containing protein n=1 Tax=Spirosoma sordidisoli TaxID=2502893 RepID=A0A4Q2UNW6_9BACT|nr:T9SS type A sorting domain-containing protein [Spirosoma sordidisoli]RYC69300.1 T9SS type A sorting domain-containing protein [Spirosoma sordidisoli]
MRYFYTFCLLTLSAIVQAQVNFSATWPFNGATTGSATHANVSTGGASFVGVAPNNVAGYVPGQNGQAVNVANWSQSAACNFSEYVQISVSAQNGQSMTLTQLTVFANRSGSGPQELRLRSSVDNYASDLMVFAVGTSFQQASASLSGAGFTSQTGTITFRLYGCNGTGGTLRLDDLTINGTVTAAPLPVSLLSFTAKPEGDRVQIAWSTAWERDASRFDIERSADLKEFETVGSVPARGTTDQQQQYGLTDLNPRPGTSYYRLRQVDYNGTTNLYTPVAVQLKTGESVVAVYPNPAESTRIHVRLWNADGATVRLLTMSGQPVAGSLHRSAGEADLIPAQPLTAGLYWLETTLGEQRRIQRVLVR